MLYIAILFRNHYHETAAQRPHPAEEHGLQLDSYDENAVFQAKNKLESAIYQLEEVFEDAIRDVSNKIDELEEDYGR